MKSLTRDREGGREGGKEGGREGGREGVGERRNDTLVELHVEHGMAVIVAKEIRIANLL